MTEPFVSIILRSFNEGWALKDTLPALQAQDFKSWELIVIDSGSTDGSQDLIRAAQPAHFIQIAPDDYNPSKVLNQGMRLSKAEIAIFLTADATPQGSNWLQPLVKALDRPKSAACFGRQIPRPDCHAVFAHDYDRCFGPNRESAHWDHFFSMVSSGVRRDIWARRGFREDLKYAEDDEYSRWCRAEGYDVFFVPESVVMHSHNYTVEQCYQRAFGDARSLGLTWSGNTPVPSVIKTLVAGWFRDLRKDFLFCRRNGRLSELAHAARIRWHQRRGRLAGFREGRKEAEQRLRK
jgi:rhamnosyltransferase